MLEERNIDYLIFINPLHEEVYEAFKRIDSYRLFLDWKQKLKAISPDCVDLSYSQYSTKNGFLESDPFHYKPETGAAFLNIIIRSYLKKTRHTVLIM